MIIINIAIMRLSLSTLMIIIITLIIFMYKITFRGLESSLSFLVSIVSVASTSGRFLLTCRRKRFVRIIEIMRIIMIMMRKWRRRGMIRHFLNQELKTNQKLDWPRLLMSCNVSQQSSITTTTKASSLRPSPPLSSPDPLSGLGDSERGCRRLLQRH